jgi:drug/metabolite transporter (DMT)-like permease
MNPGFLYAIGAAIVWGVVYCIDQRVLDIISPLPLLFLDSLITAIIMIPFLFHERHSIKTFFASGKINTELMIASIVLAAIANFLIFSGIKLVGASSASIIEIMYPFFVVLFSFIIFRTAPSAYFILGAILVFAGSAIIVYHH